MKNKPIICSTALLTVILGSSLAHNVYASDFENNYFKSGIVKASQRNVLTFDANQNIHPNDLMTRGEFASIVAKATGIEKTSTIKFKDVPSNHPFYDDIQKASSTGLIVGYPDNSFKPNQTITREEMAVMVYRFMNRYVLPAPNKDVPAFKDINDARYKDIVSATQQYGVVAGHTDNTFKPNSPITKGEAITLMARAIEKIENQYKEITGEQALIQNVKGKTEVEALKNTPNPPTPIANFDASKFPYIIEYNNGAQRGFNSKADALKFYEANRANESYVTEKGNVIYMTHGFARTKAFTLIYKQGLKDSFTYVSTDTELGVTGLDENYVYVTIAGLNGYVKRQDVRLVPYLENEDLSYYMRKGDYLYHYVYQNSKYSGYKVGKAPDFLDEGVPFDSFDSTHLKGVETYQYFNYLPLRVQSNYTGDELDKFIKSQSPDSPLNGYGHVFADAAKKNNINALYLLAHAVHESGWGKSKIATDKHNLFGINAKDGNAYNDAAYFSSFSENIYYVASYVSQNYLNPQDWVYNNGILGNKGLGMNVKYASDPYWGQKIAGIMQRADEFLGGKDYKKYTIATLKPGSSYYSISSQGLTLLGTNNLERKVAIKGTVNTKFGLMYEVTSDDNNYSSVFVPTVNAIPINTY